MPKRKYNQPCYYCGKPACSDEYAPPQMMFDGTCDSITVPSCAKHNNVKGASDQAVIHCFLQALNEGREKYLFEDKIIDAIEKNKASFDYTKYKAFNAPLIKDAGDQLRVGYLALDIHSWMSQLTAAIVWDGIKYYESEINWSMARSWSPWYFESKNAEPYEKDELRPILFTRLIDDANLNNLPWENGWSASPRPYPGSIYYFRLCFEQNNQIIFKHIFYNSFHYYVQIKVPEKVKVNLRQKVKEWKEGNH